MSIVVKIQGMNHKVLFNTMEKENQLQNDCYTGVFIAEQSVVGRNETYSKVKKEENTAGNTKGKETENAMKMESALRR